jgi:hypothetical protein
MIVDLRKSSARTILISYESAVWTVYYGLEDELFNQNGQLILGIRAKHGCV